MTIVACVCVPKARSSAMTHCALPLTVLEPTHPQAIAAPCAQVSTHH